MHALIIDDEPDARGVLRKLLNMFCPEVTKSSEAKNATEALHLAKKGEVDIAFIDIQLKKDNGLELAETLHPYVPHLIFVTAFDQYAVPAYQTSAIHYLLKPVHPELLQQAVKRAAKRQNVNRTKEARIVLTTKTEQLNLRQKDIYYLEGDGNYCHFHCEGNRKYLVSKNLAHYESLLDPNLFYRIHQSYLVRVAAVREVLTEGNLFVVLWNGDQLPLARRRKEGFYAVW
ncbi:MAG: LytTR family DNA-binding domain-containing protein [Bacteroidota bacterium]